ncbi:MAG: helix-turn-helix domain-containing protein, partial [Myxococcales bacterium]|nr:helix-turn-helix domain-containing protein [Myxococcales bacterium]
GDPSCSIELVVSLSGAVSVTFEGEGASGTEAAFVAGMHTSPVRIHEAGPSRGIHVKLSPRAVRACFGPGAAELAQSVVDLEGLAGARASELVERLSEAVAWEERHALVREFLRSGAVHPAVRPELDLAWRRLVGSAAPSVDGVAHEVGWSRRHLASQFQREYGLSPSTVRRVARFERARRALRGGVTLSGAAVAAGYFDQAHMTREWSRLAQSTPARWLREPLPSVQDTGALPCEA